jgi:hypothetical protein
MNKFLRIRNILALATFLFSMISSASNKLTCLNQATGAALEVSYFGAPSYYNTNGELRLNHILVGFFRSQGLNIEAPYLFEGYTNWSYNNFSFTAGTPKAFSLNFSADSGGLKLYYVQYSRTTPSTFFFNSGECRFN